MSLSATARPSRDLCKSAGPDAPPKLRASADRGKSAGAAQRDLMNHFLRVEQHLLEHPSTLQDEEILGMVLHFALGGRDTRPLAQAILAKYRTIGAATNAPSAELSAICDLGKKGVAALKLIQAASINLLRREITTPVIAGWDQLVNYLSANLMHERIEQFHILFLDVRGALLADEVQGRGTINHAPVYPREIVRRCLELQAASMILVHNHPSGDPTPSAEDIIATREVARAAAIMGISLHDHIIVGRFGVRSFRQDKLL